MKIVVLDGYAANPGDLSWEGLKTLGECTIYDRTAPEEVLERAAGAEAILTNKVVITAEQMTALPDLKYIGVLATGYNRRAPGFRPLPPSRSRRSQTFRCGDRR